MGLHWLGGQTEVQVPSNYINVANFLIFDVLLISLVFSLTSDISGRLNHVALKGGEPRKLVISCPPLIGGGLCTTNAARMLVMMSLRVLALVLILITNMAITGLDIQKERLVPASVLGVGSLAGFNETRFDAVLAQRRGCMGTSGDNIFYGEIRNLSRCERNLTLIENPLTISSSLTKFNASTDNCTRHILPVTEKFNKSTFICPNAVLDCYHNRTEGYRDQLHVQTCKGVVRTTNATYILQGNRGGAPQPTGKQSEHRGYQVWNFDLNATAWTNMTVMVDNTLLDGIAVMHTAGAAERIVRENVDLQTTMIHNTWFVILGGKCVLIAGLLATALLLRRSGFFCAANDEYRLTKLLSSSVAQAEGGAPEARAPIYLNAQHAADSLVVWASERPEARQRNFDRHRREELFY